MKYHLVKDGNRVIFNSLDELYLSLVENVFEFCFVESEDGKERFPDIGEAPQGRIKGLIAWKFVETGREDLVRKSKQS